jgi:hypothetical protein
MVAADAGDHSQIAQLSHYFFFFAAFLAFFLAMVDSFGLWLEDYT